MSVDPNGDTFVARLADLTGKGPEEEAEIAFQEISPDDRSLIVPGALFTWTIGRVTETSGQDPTLNHLNPCGDIVFNIFSAQIILDITDTCLA